MRERGSNGDILHQGSPGDAKIYEEILEELKRRRIARNGDTIILDKGYCSLILSPYSTVPIQRRKRNFIEA
ncbi:MAG: hypothetical protein SBU_001349 [Candidatus Syntrophoarchaeum butanivorans]|uniref:Uncharacterized protein n=1 Tax=Candidatus Syntropharchaeum butanivorans TaxID=1839936 RepID=A0A1F2P4Y8_9EURY|nr:MAG: hypothetical protein SBU_001349 [Candidatus Syntrophoarchaeum butanivorans]